MPDDSSHPTNRPSVMGRGPRSIWLFAALTVCVAAAACTATVLFVVRPAERWAQATEARTENTHKAIEAVSGILASASDAETGQRGFLLTGDTRFLRSYDDSIEAIRQRVASVGELTIDNRGQQTRFLVLRDLTVARLAEFEKIGALTGRGDLKAAIDVVREGEGRALMEAMRVTIADMIVEEERLLLTRGQDYATALARSNQITLLLLIAGSFGILIAGGSIAAAVLVANAAKQSATTADERLRMLKMVDFAPIMMVDMNDRVRFWSEGCHRLFGWTAEEAVGLASEDLLETVTLASAEEIQAELLRTGEWSGEASNRARNGEQVIVLAHKVLQRDADGNHVGVNLTAIDVSRLRRTETALHASQTQFRAVVDAAVDAIIIAHSDGTIRNVNPAVLRMFGYDRADELIGRDLVMLMPATEASRHAEYLANHRVGGPSRVIGIPGRELLAIRRDGTEFPIDLSVSSFDLDGDEFLTGVVRDVTDRRQTEMALRASESQLREALKMEVVGRLAAGVAHDFNNVLQCVAGGLEMVLDDVESGTSAHEFAEIAMSSAMRGADLTHHLLSYARKQVLQPKDVDVARMMSEIQVLLSRTIGQHIAIEIRVDEVLPRIHVDPGLLQTALLNLAINAAYSMPKGGTLQLNAGVNGGDSRHVVIAVIDTGGGMDEATLSQVFEPFFTTKGLDGTGLGLPMVQGFATQSGGEVRIESALGKGTTVELRLPASRRATGIDQLPSNPAMSRGSGRVLLVDDNSDVRVITSAFLRGAGFQVVTAVNGDEAFALVVAGEQFDVLVTDYVMPGMNGADLVEHVREIQPRLPALVITGFAAAGDNQVLPETVAILRKPFQRQQLIEAVLHAMEQQQGATWNGAAPVG